MLSSFETAQSLSSAAVIAMQGGLIWMTAIGILFILARVPLAAVFTADPGVIELAAASMIPLGLAQPFWSIGLVNSGALRGAGNTRFPLYMTILGIWGATILGIISTTVLHLGLAYVWGGFLIFSPLTAFLTWRRFRRAERQHAPPILMA